MSTIPYWRARLTPFAEIYSQLHEALAAMDLDALRQLLDDCDQPDSVNCWWATYQVAQFLPPLIQDEINRKTYTASLDADLMAAGDTAT